MNDVLVVHGLNLSYFTGKLEAYFRIKGIDYRVAEMDTRGFAAMGRTTGFRQMPQVECPDGSWLTDTSLTIAHVEAFGIDPVLTPADGVTRFIARLIEDFADETLWRPALYYRWAFRDDARLNSMRLARGMLRDLPLPLAFRRQLILRRQRRHFLHLDGITPGNAGAVEALYRETLAALEAALQDSPFILGARPTLADIGLFGPFFRHFFCDPTPARLMRDQAPRTLAWVARLWALRPDEAAAAPLPDLVPIALRPLLGLVAGHHLPALAAHAEAVAAGCRRVETGSGKARFVTAPSPYRAWCLDVLRQDFGALDAGRRAEVGALLGPAVQIIAAPRQDLRGFTPPVLPLRARTGGAVRDRAGRAA